MSYKHSYRLIPLAGVILCLLFSLACGFMGGNPPSEMTHTMVLTRLPTLTRTPLPTLTQTATSTPLAVAAAVGSIDGAPVVAPIEPAAASEEAGDSAVAGPAVTTAPEQIAQPEPAAQAPNLVSAESAQPAVPASEPLVEARSPTGLPTVAATLTPAPTNSPTASPTVTPLPTEIPSPTPTPAAWSFVGVQTLPDPFGDGFLMHGNLINQTGTAQELKAITGMVRDAQHQIIAATDSEDAYWPGYVVPSGGSMPFEMALINFDSTLDYDLNVEANPSDQTPRQDFEFSDVDQAIDETLYCVTGELQNRGGTLQDYLVIAVIVYDDEDKVISFVYYEEFAPDWVNDDERLEFELCTDLLGVTPARHELQAWGY